MGLEMVRENRDDVYYGNEPKRNCEESWLTFPVAGTNFSYEFSFSSNFHGNTERQDLFHPFRPLHFLETLDVAWMLIVAREKLRVAKLAVEKH